MNLNDYQWSRNPRGMHGTGNDHTRWSNWQLGWLKIVDVFEDLLPWAGFALEKGITPICRIHRDQFSGNPMDEDMRRSHLAYLRAGVKWHEFYNEPNIPYEWYGDRDLRPDNLELIRPLCDNWLSWAEFIINNGGYPGFISLSEMDTTWGNTTGWILNLLQYMADNHYERFRQIINNGMWLSVHPYIVNHWYQEVPGGGALSARGPAQVNYAEGGWHYEYPYDPICQADDPGRTVWGGTPSAPINDVVGLLAGGIAWLETLQRLFGVGWIPAVGTEGGIWRIPENYTDEIQPDNRYPGYNLQSHGHGTVAMFDWIADSAPGWMFGVSLWEYDYYWNNGNVIPALHMLTSSPARLKHNIPSYPALGAAPPPYESVRGTQVAVANTQPPPPTNPPPPQVTLQPTATPIPPGPGPIHGAPTHHFVFLGVQSAWVFDSGSLRQYFQLFQPSLIPRTDLINFMPASTSLAVTLIATPEQAEGLASEIRTRWRNVWIDAVTISDSAALEAVFDLRVKNGLRFV